MSRGLSDFDHMKERLHAWGRWGRQDCGRPDPETGCGSIYQMGKQDETERDPEAAPEPPPPKIDHKDCEWLDILLLNKMGREHRNSIRNYFYKRRLVAREKIDEAVRAMLDVEYIALELGWCRAA